jgi:hypothetical protein
LFIWGGDKTAKLRQSCFITKAASAVYPAAGKHGKTSSIRVNVKCRRWQQKYWGKVRSTEKKVRDVENKWKFSNKEE